MTPLVPGLVAYGFLLRHSCKATAHQLNRPWQHFYMTFSTLYHTSMMSVLASVILWLLLFWDQIDGCKITAIYVGSATSVLLDNQMMCTIIYFISLHLRKNCYHFLIKQFPSTVFLKVSVLLGSFKHLFLVQKPPHWQCYHLSLSKSPGKPWVGKLLVICRLAFWLKLFSIFTLLPSRGSVHSVDSSVSSKLTL